MPSSMSGEERAKVIANNRSLRIIKNELEALSERDVITDEQYAIIVQALPAEASLHNTVLPIPGRTSTATSASSGPLTDNFAAMSMNDRQPLPARTTTSSNTNNQAPPSYNSPTTAPPAEKQPTELAHVVALYRYNDPDPRDLNFETGDHISVTEYCNAEWWQGKNVRTGEEGIFPKTYVRLEPTPSPLAHAVQPPLYGNNGPECTGPYNTHGGPPQQQYQQQGGYYGGQQQQPPPPQQGPPGPSNPYDSAVPPMQIAEQPVGQAPPSKGAEAGKKFGKKLGNAAIFGAGATIGGNIVNSIF